MDLSNVPAHTKAGLLAMNVDRPLAKLGTSQEIAQQVLSRYMDGETIGDIAKQLEVSPERLYIILLEHCEEDWKKAQAAKASHLLDNDIREIKSSDSMLALGRARESAKLHTWRLERVARRMYGQDQPQVQINVNVGNVVEKIRDLEAELLSVPRTIDGESSPTS